MEINAKMYSEVEGVLNSVNIEYANRVPQKLKNLILKYKDKSYKIKYDMNIPLHKQNISKEALSMIALIHLNYWCENNEEKAELNKLFKENAIKNEEERKQKYLLDNIFKKQKMKVIENDEPNIQMIEYKENIFIKIINFIKKFIKK